MIQVSVRGSDGAVTKAEFETNAVEIIDGALIIYTYGAKEHWAGFAPGQWLAYERLDIR